MKPTDKERIELLIKQLKTNKNALGVSIGESGGAKFSHIISGRNKITDKLARKIVDTYPDISYEWLLYGYGNIITTDNNIITKNNIIITNSTSDIVNEPGEVYENKNGNRFVEQKNGKFKITVKKIPVKAFGSYISETQHEDFMEELEDVSFTVDHIGRGKYLCFEVEGESMNGGNIDDSPSGAELLCRELGRQHWKDGFRESKYGWVIVHEKTVLFKDISSLNSETGDIVCSSRSGLPNHPDFTINLNDVRQIFKVIKRTF